MLYRSSLVPGQLHRDVFRHSSAHEIANGGAPEIVRDARWTTALSLVGRPFFSALKDRLDDKDADVRVAAIASLAEVKDPRALAALRAALQDDTPEVSFAAAKALWSLHDPAGRHALLAV
jgi:hypothetical protein